MNNAVVHGIADPDENGEKRYDVCTGGRGTRPPKRGQGHRMRENGLAMFCNWHYRFAVPFQIADIRPG